MNTPISHKETRHKTPNQLNTQDLTSQWSSAGNHWTILSYDDRDEWLLKGPLLVRGLWGVMSLLWRGKGGIKGAWNRNHRCFTETWRKKKNFFWWICMKQNIIFLYLNSRKRRRQEEYSTTANIAEVPLFTLFSLANIRLLDRQIVSSGCQDITSPTTSLIPSYNEKPKIKRRVVECTKFTLTKLWF